MRLWLEEPSNWDNALIYINIYIYKLFVNVFVVTLCAFLHITTDPQLTGSNCTRGSIGRIDK